MSPNIALNLYSIYIIKKYISKNIRDDSALDYLMEQINEEYLLILTSLLSKNNQQLYYDTLYILVNISYTDKGEILFGSNEKIIENIAGFLMNNKDEKNLFFMGIILIKNITNKNSIVKNILIKLNIIQFFNDIYQKYIFDNDIMKNLIISLGHFIKSRHGDANILCAIKIIKSQLGTDLPLNLLTEYVYILFNLSLYNSPKVYEEMTNNDIHKYLMQCFPFDYFNKEENNNINNNSINIIEIEKGKGEAFCNELSLLILKILGKIMYVQDQKITQKVIDSGISKFLNKVFKIYDIKIIKNAFFCLSNICSGTYGEIANLYDNDTIYESFKVAKFVYEALDSNNRVINSLITSEFIKAFREINYAISLIIINSLYERLIPFVRNHNYEVVKILLKGLKVFSENDVRGDNDKNLIIYILNAISKLIEFEKNVDDEEMCSYEVMNFNEFLLKNGFKEILQKLEMNPNEDIADSAEKISDEYFNDFNQEENKNINIDDIVEDSNEE